MSKLRAEAPLLVIERAMVRMRRSQSKRTLSRMMARDLGRSEADLMLHHAVVDAIEEASEAGASPTVGEVAERLGVDPSRASRMTSASIKAGYVERTASPEDGRRISLTLTASGRGLVSLTRRFRQQYFARAMADWSERERSEFARLFGRFTDALIADTAGRPR